MRDSAGLVTRIDSFDRSFSCRRIARRSGLIRKINLVADVSSANRGRVLFAYFVIL